MKREAHAVWKGTGMDGKGVLTTTSGTLKDTPYSFHTRFENAEGTNPEELIAAAHAGCFDMALSFMLTGAGFPPDELNTKATIVMEKEGVHWTVVEAQLVLRAKVPGITSKLFKARITLDAKLA
ncbi:OsmC family peroxiredoxin [bacterium]|nr:OsmC family peroxiredoxin [bacterium]